MSVEKTRKLVVVGDGMCGKTSLLYAFMYKEFDPSHTPTIFDTYAADIQVDEKKVSGYIIIFQKHHSTSLMRVITLLWHYFYTFRGLYFFLQVTLALFDTAGQEGFERLRALSYSDTNIVLICFCVNHPASLLNVIYKWVPEIRHFCGQCPVILVACKIDLRTDSQTIAQLKREGEKPATYDMGKQIATQMKVDAYMECSAKTCEGVQEIFTHAAHLSLQKRSYWKRPIRCALY
jgi:small GTP-binding protein